jgi:iron complex outermembrane receptor protein
MEGETIKRAFILSSAVVIACAHAGVSRAQAAPPTAGADPGGTVIVTAEKRAQNIEKVPVAISAYTSKQRDIVGIDSLQDLTNFTPGLAYSTSLDRAFIRGVGRQTNNLSTQPGIASYVDGVYNSSVVTAAGDSLFVDRVEVLRGPQGTLYGRNAIGGDINAISRRPSNSFYAEARVNLGNYGVHNIEAAASGPITDWLKFRAAGYDDNQDQGYFKNVAGGPSEGGRGRSWYLEGQLQANPTPDLEAWLKVDLYGYDNSYRASNSNAPYDTPPFVLGALGPNDAFAFNPCFTVAIGTACNGGPGIATGIGGTYSERGSVTQNPGVGNLRQFASNTPDHADLSDDFSIDESVTWHTPLNADLKYIGGYTHYHYHLLTDSTGTSVLSYTEPCYVAGCVPATIYPSIAFNYIEDKTYFSNELDLTSTGSAPLQWIVGLYEYHERFDQPVDFPSPQQTQLSAPISLLTGLPESNPSNNYYHAEQNMQNDSYAGFGQVDWKITDVLKLTGGVRYSFDHLYGTENTRQITWGLPAFYPGTGVLGPFPFVGAATPALDGTAFLVSTAPARGVSSPTRINLATGFATRGLSGTWGAPSGTAGLEWTPDRDSLYYAKYSRGYKAGGFNAGAVVASPETNPEYLDAYELGAKHQWFGRMLTTNVALFYYNYYGMQVPLSVQPATGPAVTEVFNLKQVVSYGLELETIWRPVEQAQILLNYSYLNTNIHDRSDCFIDAGDPTGVAPGANTRGCLDGSQSVNGQALPESPRSKISLSGNYTFMFEQANLTFSASYIWKDKTYDSIFNRFYNLAPAYDQVDLRAVFNDAKDRYTVILYGKNVFNALGYDNAGGARLTNEIYATYQGFGLTPPATYGVELQVRFH